MTVGQLARVYEEVVGEPTRSRHKKYLIRRILWRVQARAEGDLSERARRRAAELADDAEVRVTAPRRATTSASVVLPAAKLDAADTLADSRLPAAGNVVVRKYKGQEIRVLILDDGFEYQGQRFRSLSAMPHVKRSGSATGHPAIHTETYSESMREQSGEFPRSSPPRTTRHTINWRFALRESGRFTVTASRF